MSITQEEIEEFISFLNLNNLTIKKTGDEVKSLVVQKEKLNKHWLLKIIHNYLFFKTHYSNQEMDLKTVSFALFLDRKPADLLFIFWGSLVFF